MSNKIIKVSCVLWYSMFYSFVFYGISNFAESVSVYLYVVYHGDKANHARRND